jgi:hypothetical protein
MVMEKLIVKLQTSFPNLSFAAGRQFYWSPENGAIFYKTEAKGREAAWSLLHETGHALLDHQSYQADVELLRLEVAAWGKARELAALFNITIDESHIDNCLDTYRDWLYRRSICPDCGTKCLQQSDFVHYRCFNCHKVWRVTAGRFTRAYRSQKKNPRLSGDSSPISHLY